MQKMLATLCGLIRGVAAGCKRADVRRWLGNGPELRSRSMATSARQVRGNRALRAADRWLGIPIVVVLGMFRTKRRLQPNNIRSIGILNLVALGDTVLLSGVLRDLRTAFVGVRLVLFAGEDNAEIARLLSGPDTVISLPLL